MFHIHKWGLWAITPTKGLHLGQIVKVDLQYRTCKKCGFTKVRHMY